MKTYIALLRGINVGGQTKIKMAALKVYLTELDFQEIHTYIPRGNLIFKSTEISLQKLGTSIREKIKEKYTFDVPVLIKTPQEIKHLL